MVTYPADGHSSLEVAFNDLSSGATLVIESETPHERLTLNQNLGDHATITDEGNRDTMLV